MGVYLTMHFDPDGPDAIANIFMTSEWDPDFWNPRYERLLEKTRDPQVKRILSDLITSRKLTSRSP
jgi:hypothetical protein